VQEVLWDSGLLKVLVLGRRDLVALLVSPIAYLIGALVVVPTSVLGYLAPRFAGDPLTMAGVFSWAALGMAVLTPLCTMRLLAREQRSGALEHLMTSPVRSWEVVAGKWLAGLLLFLAANAFTLIYVVLMSVYQPARSPATVLGLHVVVPNVDYGAILAGYVGLLLVGAAWVALGLLASSLTRSQVVAAVTGIAVLLAFDYVLGALAGFVAPPVSDLLHYVSAADRAQSFDQGRLVLRDVVFFLALTGGALFLTARVIESRRWR
jgi:ABC-2 type transport system permease protein